jgi:hypothetical protein
MRDTSKCSRAVHGENRLTGPKKENFPEENKLQERFPDLLRKLARLEQETPLSIAEIEAESPNEILKQPMVALLFAQCVRR